MLFSATLDGMVGNMARRITRDPMTVQIASASTRHENIDQRVHFVDDLSHKNRLLDHLLRDASMDQAVVFTATKRDADTIADRLTIAGFAAAALHGDMNQRQRSRTLSEVQDGRVRVLVATDVAARGIDVQAISHAINYDLPMQPEDYVHRIGRTGRAGASGHSISLACEEYALNLPAIEAYIGHSIPQSKYNPDALLSELPPPKHLTRARSGNGPRRSGAPRNRRRSG